jgi:hypothetical protein
MRRGLTQSSGRGRGSAAPERGRPEDHRSGPLAGVSKPGHLPALVLAGALIAQFVAGGARRGQTRVLQRTLRRIGQPASHVGAADGVAEPALHATQRDHHRDDWAPLGQAPQGAGRVLEENGKLIVVVENGLATSWVRNPLARHEQLRVFLHGKWRGARLEPRPGDPEPVLRRMNKVHAAFVRIESSIPALVEITPPDADT